MVESCPTTRTAVCWPISSHNTSPARLWELEAEQCEKAAGSSTFLDELAPWMPEDDRNSLITNALTKRIKWGAPKLGELLNLTTPEREQLHITTIRPAGMTEAEFKPTRRNASGSPRRPAAELAASDHAPNTRHRRRATRDNGMYSI